VQPCMGAGGDKDPPLPVASEPGDIDDNQDDIIIEEVRDLFASDALEEV
jgi:hypothetical protein